MADAIDFQPYLKFILPDPANQDWGDRYTPTQVELPLKVQAIVEQGPDDRMAQRRPDAQKQERFEVLAGLRKVVNEHHQVLLIGKPGSGKSTALRRLLWEDARTALELSASGQDNFTIPVLIELRDCRNGSVLEWIQKALRRLRLSQEAIEDLLFAGRFLLLFDGLNELPSTDAYLALDEFRRDKDFQTVLMMITTRELGAGADLGIEKKLAMVPLTETQMREFIQKRLPEQADNLLRQLKDRLRELAQTPLLLQMLCDVVAESPDGQPPQNRGELFRQEFARRYEKFKPLRGRVSEDSRRFAPELLQHLAFVMTQGDPHTNPLKPTIPWLTIPKAQAETILETFLTGRVEAPGKAAKEWLEDLLKFHLLQFASNPDQIEFHHQLFQEYYAAEALLHKLPKLSDTELKQNYLNYLKWTEVVALTLAMVDQEPLAVGRVQMALTVDLQLGARLAGEVKPVLQAQTVGLIHQQNVPQLLRVKLLRSTHSESAVPALRHALKDEDFSVRASAAETLGDIGSEAGVSALIRALKDEDFSVRASAAEALGDIGSEAGVSALRRALKDEDSIVLASAAEALSNIGSEAAVSALIRALKDENADVCWRAAVELGDIGSEAAIKALIRALKDEVSFVRESAAAALYKIGSKTAVKAFICALNDEAYLVREIAAAALGDIGSEAAIKALIRALKDEHSAARWNVIEALGKIGSEAAVKALRHALNHTDATVCPRAAAELGKIGSKPVVTPLSHASNYKNSFEKRTAEVLVKALIRALNDDASTARESATEVLVKALIRALNDDASTARESSAEALGKELRRALNDKVSTISKGTAEALGKALIRALNDEDYLVRISAAEVLGGIGGEAAVKALIRALNDGVSSVRESAAGALGKIGRAELLTYLWQLQLNTTETFMHSAITAIQARCGFYNYEIAQLAAEEGSGVSGFGVSAQPNSVGCREQKGNAYSIKAEVVQIIEQNHGTVIGQHPPRTE